MHLHIQPICLPLCVCVCVCVCVCASHVFLPPLTAVDGLTTRLSPRPRLDQSCFLCPGPEALLAELSHPQQSHLWPLITWVTTWGSRACWEQSQLALNGYLVPLVGDFVPDKARALLCVRVELMFKVLRRLPKMCSVILHCLSRTCSWSMPVTLLLPQ